jgi:peroxiredoxin
MKKLLLPVITIALLFWSVDIALGGDSDKAKVGEKAPDFTLVDSHGNPHTLSDFRGSIVVLEWLNHDCPFVRKFYNAGKMQEFQKKYTEKGVVWLSIISSRTGEQGHMTPEQINEANASKNVFASAVLIDEPGNVGRKYDARTTPHMFVINKEGILMYDGAIDDKPTANPADIEGARNYLVEAVEAVMNGQEVKTATTRPYGCSVKY